jgi:hypothetical protein
MREEKTPQKTDTEAADVPESAEHVDLDAITRHWRFLAAVAWDGFLAVGRGAVCVEVNADGWTATYRAGAPCVCHEELVDGYDPEKIAIIAVLREGELNLYAVDGWPCPPEAYEQAPADMLQRTVH